MADRISIETPVWVWSLGAWSRGYIQGRRGSHVEVNISGGTWTGPFDRVRLSDPNVAQTSPIGKQAAN